MKSSILARHRPLAQPGSSISDGCTIVSGCKHGSGSGNKVIFIGKIFFALFTIWVVWSTATPNATLHFPKNGIGEIRYQWNTQHQIYRGALQPGESVSDMGAVFPDERFFMVVDWWVDKSFRGCVKVTPKWYGTNIYLDEKGNLDLSPEGGTDLDRVMPCINRAEENIACRPC